MHFQIALDLIYTVPYANLAHAFTCILRFNVYLIKKGWKKNQNSKEYLNLRFVSATFLQVCFVYLKESTRETRKNVLCFTSKALLLPEIIKL